MRIDKRTSYIVWMLLVACVSAFVTSVSWGSTSDASSAANTPTTVHFGFLKPMKAYGETNYQPGEADIRKPLIQYLERALPDVHFVFESFELPDLGAAVREHRVDFALMSAGQFVETRDSGAYALATLFTQRFPDPNRFTAALFVTTDRHPEIQKIEDLQGLRAAFNSQSNFINYFLPLAEVARAGFDSEKFFARERFTGDRPPEVLRLMRSGEADVGAFRVCEFETLMRQHPEMKEHFRPILLKTDGNQACMRSTDLYPGWTVALTAPVDPAVTKRLVEALLAMPVDAASGMGWSVATEFERVDDVYRQIKVGPYAHLREWTLRRLWETYWQLILLVVVLLAGWVAHWLSVEKLAQRRARELAEAYDRQRSIEERAIETEARLSALSRLGVVSQLSSIFAHEMGQPLSAIRYRTRAVKTLFQRGAKEDKRAVIEESLGVIDEEAQKAADILQKVRSYAKGRTDRTQVQRLDLLVEKTVADLKRTGRLPQTVSLALFPVVVKGDALELGLALLNILRNAAEASFEKGHIKVSFLRERQDIQKTPQKEERSGEGNECKESNEGDDENVLEVSASEHVIVSVSNEGRLLTPEQLAEHMRPLGSRKTEGIGLGIIIIHSIAEVHGGSFRLSPRPEGGAVAELVLPMVDARHTQDRQPTEGL